MAVTKQDMLDAVEAAIQARLTGGAVQSYMIGQRNIQYIALSELQNLRDQLRKEISAGRGTGTRTYVEFEDPS